MAFLLKSDLYLSILQDELEEITRGDDTIVTSALSSAEAELKVYLFDSYDVETIFQKTGNDRHQMLLQLGRDIAIYFLTARLQAGQDTEDRRQRFDRAIAWLKMVQKTKTYADLPRREIPVQTHIQYGSNPKRKNYF